LKQKLNSFLAIDFETANHYRNIIYALGLAKVKNNEFIRKKVFQIKPIQKKFHFTYIQGIT